MAMRSSMSVGGRRNLIVVAGAAVVATCIWISASPRSVQTLTGVRPTPVLLPPDDLPSSGKDDATPFFERRDEIRISVAEPTTLRGFLDSNRLNKPAQRKQIVEQLGSEAPETVIAAGTTFTLRLTPRAADVPGLKPTKPPKASR